MLVVSGSVDFRNFTDRDTYNQACDDRCRVGVVTEHGLGKEYRRNDNDHAADVRTHI